MLTSQPGTSVSTDSADPIPANLPTDLPTHLPADFSTASLPQPKDDTVRHLLLGSLTVLEATIKILHKRGYAEPNDWSRPLPTGRPDEMMAILTKRVVREERD